MCSSQSGVRPDGVTENLPYSIKIAINFKQTCGPSVTCRRALKVRMDM